MKAFTLIEVMLTIALVALISTAFVINLDSLLSRTEMESLENEYWRAVDRARTDAVFNSAPYFLEWNEDEKAFEVTSGEERARFEVDTSEYGDVEVEVGFFPDGTCTPFTVTLKIADSMTRFQMDPWTSVRLVDPNDES